MNLPPTHKAVQLYPPSFDIRLEELSIPTIQHEEDAIVKIELAGLCGSDLHAYRGAEPFNEPFIMGHEFVGQVVALGSTSTASQESGLVEALAIGDKVVSPFTTSCGRCQFCRLKLSSRCTHSLLFGSPTLAGAQAQYIRVPNARGTLVKLTQERVGDIRNETLLLLADILPTGYHAIRNALAHPNLVHLTNPKTSSGLQPEEWQLVLGIVGLGPVGLCALISTLDTLSEQSSQFERWTILAVDLNESRRTKAQAIVLQLFADLTLKGAAHVVGVEDALKLAGEMDGCHAVCEIVGNNSALRLSYDLLRPFGVISTVGVHTSSTFPLTGDQFDDALTILKRRRKVFEKMIVERVVGFGDIEGDGKNVKEAYALFERGIWGKVVFDPWI